MFATTSEMQEDEIGIIIFKERRVGGEEERAWSSIQKKKKGHVILLFVNMLHFSFVEVKIKGSFLSIHYNSGMQLFDP